MSNKTGVEGVKTAGGFAAAFSIFRFKCMLEAEKKRIEQIEFSGKIAPLEEGDRTMMAIWNIHLLQFKEVEESQIPQVCIQFVKMYRGYMRQENLRCSFVLHLTNFHNIGLLGNEEVLELINLFDSEGENHSVNVATSTNGPGPN